MPEPIYHLLASGDHLFATETFHNPSLTPPYAVNFYGPRQLIDILRPRFATDESTAGFGRMILMLMRSQNTDDYSRCVSGTPDEVSFDIPQPGSDLESVIAPLPNPASDPILFTVHETDSDTDAKTQEAFDTGMLDGADAFLSSAHDLIDRLPFATKITSVVIEPPNYA